VYGRVTSADAEAADPGSYEDVVTLSITW
jgi:hypothetical protein